MEEKLWRFIDDCGTFASNSADKIRSLYFPLANDSIMSSISPDLHGDIKSGQNSFLLTPVSRIDLANLKSSRNFWIYLNKGKVWSATGVSKDIRQIEKDNFSLEAGLLWQEVSRENKKIGLRAKILSFVPASGEPVEIMQVTLTNVSRKKIKFIPTTAIPIYARGAGNLRDHRHVTSLLQRITLHKFGVISKPTLAFDELAHKPNKTLYFVLGWDEKFNPPEYLYPTQEMFCGEAGDLEAPGSVLENLLPHDEQIQGREAMGALRFKEIILPAGESRTYLVIMGISEDNLEIKHIINKFKSLNKVQHALQETKDYWQNISQQLNLSSGIPSFDNWFRWVSIQPTLRRIFGCSFLPDFDYGKGGRGWRDLWQDCLGLILTKPKEVRRLLIDNFQGVRIDGSNATIIGKKPGEFIADRNSIARVWMDHGIWPLLTLDLYINETGERNILFEETSYFRDHQIFRSQRIDNAWNPNAGNKLKAHSGKIYKGTLLEHILVETLVQFFNVGKHNHVRLEGADWNDGLDMARENGESITFSAMYAHNLELLAQLLLDSKKQKFKIFEELKILLRSINYNSVAEKRKVLNDYFSKVQYALSGRQIDINIPELASDLKVKADWMMGHIRKAEWLEEGFFNGYYDNQSRPVEGRINNLIRMSLTSQVFPIMSGTAEAWQIKEIIKSADRYLLDEKLEGYHLNTDFPTKAGKEQRNLGRAFSFIYGDKENGAFFNHMVVMFAYSLYKRGFVKEGWKVLSSIHDMAIDTEKSKIYPCLPEYFNLQGRGMYSYLTGSASWFVLTILTQVFGVRGQDGDLLIEPKLAPEQFKQNSKLSIYRIFQEKKLRINFSAPYKPSGARYKIVKATLNSHNLPTEAKDSLLIKHSTILRLPANKTHSINITLR